LSFGTNQISARQSAATGVMQPLRFPAAIGARADPRKIEDELQFRF